MPTLHPESGMVASASSAPEAEILKPSPLLTLVQGGALDILGKGLPMRALSIIGAPALHHAAATEALPIIDMHMHAWSLQESGGNPPPGCLGARGVDMHGIDPAKPFDFSSQATCKVMVEAPRTD